jgi:hypothetical protein
VRVEILSASSPAVLSSPGPLAIPASATAVGATPALFAAGTVAGPTTVPPPPPSTNIVYRLARRGDEPDNRTWTAEAVQGAGLEAALLHADTEVWWTTRLNQSKYFYLAFNPSSYNTTTSVKMQIASVSLPNLQFRAGSGLRPLSSLAYAYLQVYPTDAAGAAGTSVLNNFFSNTGLSSSVLTFPLNIQAGITKSTEFVVCTSPLSQTVQFDPSLTVMRLRLLDPELQPLVFDNEASNSRFFTQISLMCTISTG